MGDVTGIAWTNRTWNPWEGCTKVSPACDYCYAWVRNERFHGGQHWGPKAPRRYSSEANWKKPYKWNREAWATGKRDLAFCASLADIFDNRVPEDWRQRAYRTIHECSEIDWQLVTKRIGNVESMVPGGWRRRWPPHIWLLITVATQEEANRDIPKLIELKRRFGITVIGLSIEPMLGPMNISRYLKDIDWVICGGESGRERADIYRPIQPIHPDWVRDLLRQCIDAAVPFFFKQWGAWVPWRASAGREPSYIDADGSIRCDPGAHRQPMMKANDNDEQDTFDGRRWLQFPKARTA